MHVYILKHSFIITLLNNKNEKNEIKKKKETNKNVASLHVFVQIPLISCVTEFC